MAKILIFSIIAVSICDAGFIPDHYYSHFPNLNTVYHGHGATSYQNVQIQNHLSVPIPKDLQVDDGYSHDVMQHHNEDPELLLDHLPDSHIALEHSFVSNDVPYEDTDDILHYDSEHYDHD
ncbi:uncharacterized protein [Chelonus insularis]|uniref:uncharacterized protein n=1 Tax=Chelonus insularis TaxID=460826 RepID=UPI00158D3F9F|nr:uncharacterized protein LOC118074614 [Chelonus insularis]